MGVWGISWYTYNQEPKSNLFYMDSALVPQTLEHQNQVENHRTLNTKPWAKSISRLKTPRHPRFEGWILGGWISGV